LIATLYFKQKKI